MYTLIQSHIITFLPECIRGVSGSPHAPEGGHIESQPFRVSRRRLLAEVLPPTLLICGYFLPLFTRTVTLGSLGKDVLLLPLMQDDTGPIAFTLAGMIWTLCSEGDLATACLALFCFMVIPVIECRRRLDANSNVMSTAGNWEQAWMSIRCWGLLPVLLAGLVILHLKRAKEGAVIELEIGFYVILVALLLRALPKWSVSLIEYVRASTRRRRRVLVMASEVNWLPKCLSYASVATLLVGLTFPFFRLERRLTGGLVEWTISRLRDVETTDEYSILSSINLLWQHGDTVIVVGLILASVIFPLAKSVALICFLHMTDRPHWPYLNLLKQLGPWSMLDAVVALLLAVAYVAFPGGTSVTLLWAYWVFITSIFLNSLALGLTHYHTVGKDSVHSEV